MNLSYPIIKEVFISLIAPILLYFMKKGYESVQKKWKQTNGENIKAIAAVNEAQIREFNIGRNKNDYEKKDAIEFLKHDMPEKVKKISSKKPVWQELVMTRVYSHRNLYIYFGFLGVSYIGNYILGGNRYVWTVLTIIVVLVILIQIGIIISLGLHVSKIKKERKNIFREINKALLLLGSTIKIDLYALIDETYSKNQSLNPTQLLESLKEIGFVIEKTEIDRVLLAYQIRNNSESERRKVIEKIFVHIIGNEEEYLSASDDERKKLELIMLENYLGDPYTEVKIIPI